MAAGHRVTWRFTFLSLSASLKPDPAATCPPGRRLSGSALSPHDQRPVRRGIAPHPPCCCPRAEFGENLSQRGKKKEEEREGERDAHLTSSYRALSIMLGPLKVPFYLLLRTTLPEPISAPSLGNNPQVHGQMLSRKLDAEVCLGSVPMSLSLFLPLSSGGHVSTTSSG